ncbi:MAG TPA: hypothetical protein VIE68_02180 [Gemmatimonadota bacterium]
MMRLAIAWIPLLLLACGGGPMADPSPLEPPGDRPTDLVVEGRVLAGPSGGPVAGAQVARFPQTVMVETDADGRYRLEIPRAQVGDSVDVIAYADGFEQEFVRLAVIGRDSVAFDFTLTPLPVSPPTLGDSLEFAVWTILDDDFCMIPGEILEFSVRVRNSGLTRIPRIVIRDSLFGKYSRDLDIGDVRIVPSSSSSPRVTLGPRPLDFTFEAENVPPTGDNFIELYSVRLPSSDYLGVWCNAISVEVGEAAASETSCYATTLALRIQLDSQDGAIVGGVFDPGPEVFSVGDGGEAAPNALVYRIAVKNDYCHSLPDVIVTDRVGLRAGGIDFHEGVSGYPTQGAIESADSRGFTWAVGTLGPGETATMVFRAVARAPGEEINRMTFSSEIVVPGGVSREEATLVR